MARSEKGLAGKRILVVEDEFLLALDAAATLEACGVKVVGPAYSIERALALAATEDLDAAMLDVNLKGANSLPVALALERRGVPIMYATGYGAKPRDWPAGPVIDKPYSAEQIGGALASLLSGTARPEPASPAL
ncbi:MAG: response regulator [Rhizobiaceae bacterium]|nr:MAG: response regulator [Rhizobiaceae bacterium]CAG1014769.1 hypothetical protein RHIZO_04870 [Rhizobiaceae bacterium]